MNKNIRWIVLLGLWVSSCYATFHGGQFNGVRGAMNVWGLLGDQKMLMIICSTVNGR